MKNDAIQKERKQTNSPWNVELFLLAWIVQNNKDHKNTNLKISKKWQGFEIKSEKKEFSFSQ